MSDCCPTILEPALTWPASWMPTAFTPTLPLPVEWTAAVFGQYDLRARACGCAVVRNVLIGGAPKDVFPPPPIWRTKGDYYDSHLDIILGNPQPDSPAWLTAKYLRDTALNPGESGVICGVVPLSWLAGVVIPTLVGQEIAAQAAASAAFAASVSLPMTFGYWSSSLAWSPLATATYADRTVPNVPRRIVATLTAAGVLTVDRESMSILAAARAQALREVPLFVVYV